MSDPKRLAEAAALVQAGRLREAEKLLERLLKKKPAPAAALLLAASLHHHLGQPARAISHLRRALEHAPHNPQVHHLLGGILAETGDAAGALMAARRVVELAPGLVAARRTLSYRLCLSGRYAEAVTHLSEAERLAPGDAATRGTLGSALLNLGRLDEAEQMYHATLAVEPGNVPALRSLAFIHYTTSRPRQALEVLERLAKLVPDSADLRYLRLINMRLLCQWDGARELELAVRRDVAAGAGDASPVGLLELELTPAEHQLAARQFALRQVPRPPEPVRQTPAAKRRTGDGCLTVGYLSPDFRTHPVATLFAPLATAHDRGRVRVIAYATSAEDGSDARQQVRAACDAFVDLTELDDAAAARRIADDGVDVLVDLAGLSPGCRLGILARRPAPVQVNYLGFAGTTGVPYVDYIVGDRVAFPPGIEAHFSEQPVRLPDCFLPPVMPPDTSPPPPASRTSMNLPDDAVVFASINRIRKLSPEIYDDWMQILRAVPEGVLWIGGHTDDSRENLWREAEARGVTRERIHFLGWTPGPMEHLARLGCADLFLDTYPYNAHTTAVDALWMGVPVITRPGPVFPSRVAASLLASAGVPELIAPTREAYVALAIALARDPERRAGLRRRIASGPGRMTLFDPHRLARNLEDAFRIMVDRQRAGEPPAPIEVPPTPSPGHER